MKTFCFNGQITGSRCEKQCDVCGKHDKEHVRVKILNDVVMKPSSDEIIANCPYKPKSKQREAWLNGVKWMKENLDIH